MPCRKENYIFLEQSVTVGVEEVDALVTKIGEALQLHNNSANHQKPVSVSVSCRHGDLQPAPSCSAVAGQKRHGCCMRLRNRVHSRSSPYNIPGSRTDSQDWDHIRPWSRRRTGTGPEEDDDPHRMLQDLILSGNLIKEAVRRLQFSAADCGDFTKTTESVTC